MPYIYLEATHHEFDPQLAEYAHLIWTRAIPHLGERVTINEQRFWEVVAIDKYRLVEQTQPEFEAESAIFLGHCALQQGHLPERQRWVRVEMYQENPLTILHLFVSPERNVIQSRIHLYGKRVKVGSHLKQYDHSRREFILLPWRVSRMDTYLPSPDINPYYCYAAIHVAHCVQVPLPDTELHSGNVTLQTVTP